MSNYICRLNENVKREHVRYYNRYGIALAGDLYTAKTMDQKQKHMAVIVGRHMAASRNSPCVYAKRTGTKRIYCADF